MGEVYRARDTRLGREVAVKVLLSGFSASPILRERLEREAKVVSSLSHPHICTLHDIGREGEVDFLVMEYLEGETLADRLTKGRMPLEQALRYASEIADALDMAHRRGVIHRDLKPGNVMLTKSGAKLLDFGLAKLREAQADRDAEPLSRMPTQARPLTGEGRIVGTYPYMAPEQLEGKAVDARTDIFAFGAMLYEMVTAQRAFHGESRASLIAAIMSSQPRRISELQPMTPPMLDRVARRCLEKDPDERWQSADDLAAALGWIIEGGLQAEGSSPRLSRRTRVFWALSVVVGAVLAALVTAFSLGVSRPEAVANATSPPARFALDLPARQHVFNDRDNRMLSLSGDGRLLAWIGGPPERLRVFVRPLDGLEVRGIPGTEGALPTQPVFSPSGDRILFVRGGTLWSVSWDGGLPARLWKADTPTGIWDADWIDEETVIVSLAHSGLHRLPARGGALEPVTQLDRARGEVAHQRPHVLPGGRAVLFSVGIGNLHDNHIEVVSLETGARQTIVEEASEAQYTTSGHVVFGREDTLFAVPFDLERLQVKGPAVPVLKPVQMDAYGRTANFALSRSGVLAYVPGDQGLGQNRLEWRDRKGRIEPLPVQVGMYVGPRISPDGRQLAVTQRQGHRLRVSLYEFGRQVLAPLEQRGTWDSHAVWNPDGNRLALTSNRTGQWNLFVTETLGATEAEHLVRSANEQFPGSWSPDGALLAYVNRSEEDQFDIWLLPMEKRSRDPVSFLASDFNEVDPAFSPDGRWLAYVSGETGQAEVFVCEVNRGDLTPGVHRKVSRNGGWGPVWARDSSELFYSSLDGRWIFGTKVAPTPSLVLGDEREVLGPLHPWWSNWTTAMSRFDVTPDGERFLVVSSTRDPEAPMRLVVALDWTRDLGRLAPRGRE
jgi:Tol biopolymer transport system component